MAVPAKFSAAVNTALGPPAETDEDRRRSGARSGSTTTTPEGSRLDGSLIRPIYAASSRRRRTAAVVALVDPCAKVGLPPRPPRLQRRVEPPGRRRQSMPVRPAAGPHLPAAARHDEQRQARVRLVDLLREPHTFPSTPAGTSTTTLGTGSGASSHFSTTTSAAAPAAAAPLLPLRPPLRDVRATPQLRFEGRHAAASIRSNSFCCLGDGASCFSSV